MCGTAPSGYSLKTEKDSYDDELKKAQLNNLDIIQILRELYEVGNHANPVTMYGIE